MSEALYPYYERELLFIRQLSQEFARQYPAAAGRLSAALTAAERTGRVVDAIGIQLDLAKVLSGSDREAAVEQLAAATAEARAAGSVALGRVADRGLRELGIRTWRRGPAGRPRGRGRSGARR